MHYITSVPNDNTCQFAIIFSCALIFRDFFRKWPIELRPKATYLWFNLGEEISENMVFIYGWSLDWSSLKVWYLVKTLHSSSQKGHPKLWNSKNHSTFAVFLIKPSICRRSNSHQRDAIKILSHKYITPHWKNSIQQMKSNSINTREYLQHKYHIIIQSTAYNIHVQT